MMQRPFVGAFCLTLVTGALFGAYFLFRVTRMTYNPGLLILAGVAGVAEFCGDFCEGGGRAV
ncbi:hypothetical protein ACQ86N_35575 [Puia sp. P3]|uniref:hypothetical protein n=1 Tax=Puia sp. P3 TaxID=3423952 RepID=UPI003D6703DB